MFLLFLVCSGGGPRVAGVARAGASGGLADGQAGAAPAAAEVLVPLR